MRYLLLLPLSLLLVACERRPPIVNDAPQDAVEVTVVAPGMPPEGKVSAIAHYLVEDDRCLPLDYSRALGGTKPETTLQHIMEIRRVGDGSFGSTAFGDYYAPTVVRRGYRPCRWALQGISVQFNVRGTTRTSWLKESDIASGTVKHEACRFADPVPDFCRPEPEGESLRTGFRIALQATRAAARRAPGQAH